MSANGAALGWSLWLAVAPTGVDPARWTLRASPMPRIAHWVAGSLPAWPGALALEGYQAARPAIPEMEEGSLVVRATLPEDGQLQVRLGVRGDSGPENPEVPPVTGGPQPPVERRTETAAVVVDRGMGRVYGRGLDCRFDVAVFDEVRLELVARRGRVRVGVDGKEVGTCRGGWERGAVELASGVRRIRIEGFSSGSFADTFGPGPRLGAGMAVLGALLGAMVGRAPLALASSPLVLATGLGWQRCASVVANLRLAGVGPGAGTLLVGGIPALLLVLCVLGRRSAGAVLALVAGLVAWCAPSFLPVLLPLLPWAVLVRTRRGPGLSLALSAALLVLAEVGVRASPIAESWQLTSGWRTSEQSLARVVALHDGDRSAASALPVKAPTHPREGRFAVAFGGSSTAGALGGADRRQLWPALLDEALDGWTVSNQGAPGWSSLHIRLYADVVLPDARPELVLVYTGYNDRFTLAPIVHRSMAATPSGAAAALADALGRSRLYVGLRFAVQGLQQGVGESAVPPADTRRNLTRVVGLARTLGANVLVVTEATNPDRRVLADYAAIHREVAEAEGARWLDAGAVLPDDPDVFIDDVHLSATGQQALAAAIQEALEGWI
jgi:lysophospholipase L1-like esterase